MRGVGRGVGVAVGLGRGVILGVGVGRGVTRGVGVGLGVTRGVGVGRGVNRGVGVGRGVKRGEGEGVGRGVTLGEGEGVGVGRTVGLGVGFTVGEALGFGEGFTVGTGLGATRVGEADGDGIGGTAIASRALRSGSAPSDGGEPFTRIAAPSIAGTSIGPIGAAPLRRKNNACPGTSIATLTPDPSTSIAPSVSRISVALVASP